ncbi:MAG: T9SS type A sorting domain-containing protein [Bacteroidetes bacterium]|nr:T9SS type A sorting domain-containing protein [Bacteroidota bacterium]
MIKRTCFLLSFSLILAASIAQNSAQMIVDDMTLPPDAALHGVPSYYSWASGAAHGQNPVPAKNNQGEWFRAMTSWGQVYIPVNESPATNTRCQIRNMVSKFLYKNGNWVQVQSGNPQGAAFVEDFANNASIAAGMRDETGNGGGISVIVGVGAWTGYNFHYWPAGSRAIVDVDSVTGVFTSCEARLIIDDPGKADDRSICKNILQMGGDWWLNQTIGWLPDWSANSGIGNGRAKWVTTTWQSFNYCSLKPSEILANPPVEPASIAEDLDFNQSVFSYPNPASDKISIVLPADWNPNYSRISIYDIHGILLYQHPFEKHIMIFDLVGIAKGLLFLKIESDRLFLTQRILRI